MNDIKSVVSDGEGVIGIELGSTRIKAVLVDKDCNPLASGFCEWENRLENGIWTYSEDDIWNGLAVAYASLKADVKAGCGVTLKKVKAIGISAMMHGYLAFDGDDRLLVPFRTWRNATTKEAAEKLSELFKCNIPQRWSIAHLYQAILNDEPHVKDICSINTLAGYVSHRLTGTRVLGTGDASGMFPIDAATGDYDSRLMKMFDELTAEKGYPWKLREILPEAVPAGRCAGHLTSEGALLLDPEGDLLPGAAFAPAEGDAGTGMAATNSVRVCTGNVSAGTSIFGMFVLEDDLKGYYPQIDMVTTPDGKPVAMVHANNCTSDINAWVSLFSEFAGMCGFERDSGEIFEMLFKKAMEGDPDCGGLLSYGFVSGENIMDVAEGRPLFVRSPESNFNLANFMRTNICTAFGALKVGMDILKEEGIKVDSVYGHGGMFKTEGVAQKLLAEALGAPVSVMETAGEGGPWGMAILASYMARGGDGESLADYLSDKVFSSCGSVTEEPDARDVEGFNRFIERYRAGIGIEKAAISDLI